MQRQLKKSLNAVIAGCYIALAITVLMVGRGNPVNILATLSALSAFFVVATLFALVPFYGLVRRLSLDSKGFKVTTGVSGHHVMVAQAGQLSGWPGSSMTGISTPAWAIASERGNSSDSFETTYWRMPQWLQPQNTQNPRSPNSVTTAVVSFIAHRWWYFICTSSIWTVMKKRCSCIFLTFFPTSTTILRL
ncbi:ash family protein [Salmonella enterica]|nr:ash family protein [Salmonella enterica]EGL4360082.1 ash family protein [Salmonella enterica]EGL4383027.1 ash family protein [Salmonella enterica]EGL4488319.1 ash family protein [Salmonella enterica]EGL4515554.1 ash family protein [Salmonella enterica]